MCVRVCECSFLYSLFNSLSLVTSQCLHTTISPTFPGPAGVREERWDPSVSPSPITVCPVLSDHTPTPSSPPSVLKRLRLSPLAALSPLPNSSPLLSPSLPLYCNSSGAGASLRGCGVLHACPVFLLNPLCWQTGKGGGVSFCPPLPPASSLSVQLTFIAWFLCPD